MFDKRKQEAWRRYREAVDNAPMGSKEWLDAVAAGPAGFMDGGNPVNYLQNIDPELHDLKWRAYWGLLQESENNQ